MPDVVSSPEENRKTQEAHRLLLQAEVYDPLTCRFLLEAGLCEGMRVLDIGSGTGSVSLASSRLVGQGGSVVGIECDSEMAELARRHASKANATNIQFICGYIESVEITGDFDAIVGRFVLRELKDPAKSLRRLSQLLVPGGLIAFQEKVLAIPPRAFPPAPVMEQVQGWMDEARRLAGVEIVTGTKLKSLYIAAGLPLPSLRCDVPVSSDPEWSGYDYLVETLRGMMPLIHLFGIADDWQIDIDTLGDRLRAEAAALAALLFLTPCVGAWTTKK